MNSVLVVSNGRDKTKVGREERKGQGGRRMDRKKLKLGGEERLTLLFKEENKQVQLCDITVSPLCLGKDKP